MVLAFILYLLTQYDLFLFFGNINFLYYPYGCFLLLLVFLNEKFNEIQYRIYQYSFKNWLKGNSTYVRILIFKRNFSIDAHVATRFLVIFCPRSFKCWS